MDNAFLTDLFDWQPRDRGGKVGTLNRLLQKLKLPWVVSRALDPTKDMTNLLQRHNLWHLAMQTVAAQVPGAFVDLGCFDGKTSVIFARVLQELAPERTLHLYDHFEMGFHLTGQDIQKRVLENFHLALVPEPQIHSGDFAETIPAQLPSEIAFAHIDCGCGADVERHRETLMYLLEQIYPRLSPRAVCILADYHDSTKARAVDYNPGVRLAVQDFFAHKPEQVSVLLANEYTHGYFRKG